MAFDINDFMAETDQDDTESSDLEVPEVEETEEAVDEVEQEESDLDEVDRRLDIASFYRALLKNPLFNGAREKNSSATIVEKEVRDFCRGRLNVLMGVKAEATANVQAPSLFSKEQSDALIAIANQLLAKNRTIPVPAVMPTTVTGPTVNSVSTGTKPAPKAQVKAKPKAKSQPPKPLFEEKVAMDANGQPVLNNKGEPIILRNQRVQKPAGQVPFPADVAQATELRLINNPGGGTSAGANLMATLIGHHQKE